MAKASVVKVCSVCGKEYTMCAIKRNRREADSWERWAEGIEGECPECYKERKRKEANEKPVVGYIRMGDNILWQHQHPTEMLLEVAYKGGTYPHKDALKASGCGWDGLAWSREIVISEEQLKALYERKYNHLEDIVAGECKKHLPEEICGTYSLDEFYRHTIAKRLMVVFENMGLKLPKSEGANDSNN